MTVRPAARLGAIVPTAILAMAAAGRAADDAADTEAPADEAVGKCVTACEAEHDQCVVAAKGRKDDCQRQKSTCESGCATCTRMNGPLVVTCINDCAACRNRINASPCAKDAGDDTDCTRALDACLERCGP